MTRDDDLKLADGMEEFYEFCMNTRKSSGPHSDDDVTEAGTPEERRLRMETFAEIFDRPYPDNMKVRNWYVTAPGREIPVRIYRPSVADKFSIPTLLYFHGGGWVQGSLDTHDEITAAIAEHAEVQVVAVHFRRPPENPHPAAVNDCFKVLQWVRNEGQLLGLNGDRIGIAGDSAGGHLSASLTQKLKLEGLPNVLFQVLIYPAMDTDFTTSSYTEYERGPWLTTEDMRYFWSAYMPDVGDESDPVRYPARAEDLSGLPPALIVNAQHDPLRDDGINYGQKLKDAGVTVDVRTVEGMTHAFLRARYMSAPAAREFNQICNQIKAHLHA